MVATDIWTIYRITTRANSKAILEIETKTTHWVQEMPLKQALEMAGKSRTGLCGQPVIVYLDEIKI